MTRIVRSSSRLCLRSSTRRCSTSEPDSNQDASGRHMESEGAEDLSRMSLRTCIVSRVVLHGSHKKIVVYEEELNGVKDKIK